MMLDIGDRATEFSTSQEIHEIINSGGYVQPDLKWRYKRGDGKEVKWEREGIYYHIPWLVKEVHCEDPITDMDYETISQCSESYIDPTNGNTVEPGMRPTSQSFKVPGRQNIKFIAMLTKQETKQLSEPHDIKFVYGGKNWLAEGCMLRESIEYPDIEFIRCDVTVSNVKLI